MQLIEIYGREKDVERAVKMIDNLISPSSAKVTNKQVYEDVHTGESDDEDEQRLREELYALADDDGVMKFDKFWMSLIYRVMACEILANLTNVQNGVEIIIRFNQI